jgi:hypothetical protein
LRVAPDFARISVRRAPDPQLTPPFGAGGHDNRSRRQFRNDEDARADEDCEHGGNRNLEEQSFE